jgi:hypothetical protein
MRHDGAPHQRFTELNCDRLRGALTSRQHGPCLLDELLRRPSGREHSSDCSRHRADGRPGRDQLAGDLDGIASRLHRQDERLDGLRREPARPVGRVGSNQLDLLADADAHRPAVGRTTLTLRPG